MLSRSFVIICLLLSAFVSNAFAGDDVPTWLQQATIVPVPTYDDKDVPAVVLHNEQTLTLGSDGKLTTVTMYAVKILTREGRSFADATEVYLTDVGKIREMRAWLIGANGVVKTYGKDDVADIISDRNDIYNEYRVKRINASKDADIGMVFGYQAISEEIPLFGQDVWRFQRRLPTLLSRYTLALPSGWRASSVTFNHEKVIPTERGSTFTWELRNLQPIRPEPSSPPVSTLAPRIAVNFFPGEGTSGSRTRTFDSWLEVSRWATGMHDPQAMPDSAVATKVKELTSGAATELERIRAIARFVQDMQYISVDIGVGRGNGYRPHSATQVFAKLYGDCKDKANLMRAMLKTIEIQSYPIVVFAGDRTYVREEWASPLQFNHCIIAIKVSDATQGPMVFTDPKLGRLLIFDATASSTMVGDLPDDEQGSFALILAGDNGSLIRLPVTTPEANQLMRDSEVRLSADGSIAATIRERAVGQTAAGYRGEFRALSRPEYVHMVESWIGRGANGATITKIDPTDNRTNGEFGLTVEFTAKAYGQLIQGRLLVFRPAVLLRQEPVILSDPKRSYPIVLKSVSFDETVRINLPTEFAIDEMPEAVNLQTSFATFSAKYEVKDGQLVFTRKLTQRAATVPAEQYAETRNFFARMIAAEQAPAVLVKK